jgi:hypothetical protein
MRLLQLSTGPGELLDLHPNVTVVQGLDDAAHRLLVDAVAQLARAEGVPGSGLLEAHGVLFELHPDLLRLLDLSGHELDPIVRPGDLPTQPLTVDARELRAREHEFSELLARISVQAERQSQARGALVAAAAAVEQARRARDEAETGAAQRIAEVDDLTQRLDHLAEERRRAEEQVADAQPAREAAEAELREVEATTSEVRDAARAAAARCAELEAEREALDADRRPDAAAAVEQAQTQLGEVMTAIEAERARDAAAAAEAPPEDDSAPAAEPAGVRLERVDARLGELDHALVALAAGDLDEVAEALAVLQGGDSAERVPSPDAMALAEDIDRIDLKLASTAGGELEEGSLTEARARLDDARQALLEAEQDVRNPELDVEEVLRLEDAHEELLRAIDKADGRFAGSRARARVDELRDAEQTILDRLGYRSFTDYMVGASLHGVDPEKEAALRSARSDLAAAEAEWERLERETDAALARAAVLDRRRAHLDEARRLLGPGVRVEQITSELRALRVPAVSVADSARRLQGALERAGLEVGDEELDEVELALMADTWLSEATDAEARRQTLVTERAALLLERDALRAEVAAEATDAGAPAPVAAPDPEEERAARLASARARLEEAEQQWLVHELAEDRRAALDSALVVAAEAARSAAAAAADAEAMVLVARAAVAPLAARQQALEAEWERIMAAEQEITERLRELSDDTSLDPAALDAEIELCEARRRDAETDLDAQNRALEVLDAEGQAAAIEIERLQDIVAAQGTGTATEAEELEWYLLARLAAQRSVSVAGSLPLLLDDALRGLEAGEVGHVLDRLERMGEAVQVIVVSEDPLVASWASAAGPARAAVVRPGAP